eukprot:scaffold42573_cov48-Phaeocystis_antarctica.AAC.1
MAPLRAALLLCAALSRSLSAGAESIGRPEGRHQPAQQNRPAPADTAGAERLHRDVAALPDECCTTTCAFALDGVCDDGGLQSTGAWCLLGSDCGDCPSRCTTPPPPPAPPPSPPPSPPPPSPPPLEPDFCCMNTCGGGEGSDGRGLYAADGECDDGGP